MHGKPLATVPMSAVTPDLVQAALAELWAWYPAQGRRALAMFERVLDYARAKGMRQGDNPASWRRMFEYRFPRRRGIDRRHYTAMPYERVPGFIKALRVKQARSTAAIALEITILTACRRGEVLGMQWAELDWDQALWNIPAERTKAGREHRVPLSSRVVELLKLQRQYSPMGTVFAVRCCCC